ncbi:hypothetical protein ACGFZQ_45000 [Streptomyces sp. NPDC048254]|uniref:hypothetical protein n=1 Tax=Streptomyces sp. NPDC048254 TaxID=3365525 RepID=UPI003717D789
MVMGNIGPVLTGVGLTEDVPGPLHRAISLLGIAAITAFGLFFSLAISDSGWAAWSG